MSYPHRIQNDGFRKEPRSGSVALMMVLILALLVGTFAASISGRASHERRSGLRHQTIETLESAIDAVAQLGLGDDTEFRLPLDESSEQDASDQIATKRWVIVEAVSQSGNQQQYKATLYRNDHPGLSIHRMARGNQ